jgi:hypothetical protein
MPKFNVVGAVSGSKYLGTFEAATAEEAIEMALNSDEASVSLCHQCCCECEDPEITEAFADEVSHD